MMNGVESQSAQPTVIQLEDEVEPLPAAQAAARLDPDALPFFLAHYKDLPFSCWTRLGVILGSLEVAQHPASAIRAANAYAVASPARRIEFDRTVKGYVAEYQARTGRPPCNSDENLRAMSVIWMQLDRDHKQFLAKEARLSAVSFDAFFEAAKGHGGVLFDTIFFLQRLADKSAKAAVYWIALALHWKMLTKEQKSTPEFLGPITVGVVVKDLGDDITYLTCFNLWCLTTNLELLEAFVVNAMRMIDESLAASIEQQKKIPRKKIKVKA